MDVPNILERDRMLNRWAVVSTGSMAHNGTIVEASPHGLVVENGTNRTRLLWAWVRNVAIQKGTEPKAIPMPAQAVEANWDWNIDDPEAPQGKSLQSAWRPDGQVWKAYTVTVTIYTNGELPRVTTMGYPLTKKGLKNRTTGVSQMRLTDQDEFRFIEGAFEHLDGDLVRTIQKRIEERDA